MARIIDTELLKGMRKTAAAAQAIDPEALSGAQAAAREFTKNAEALSIASEGAQSALALRSIAGPTIRPLFDAAKVVEAMRPFELERQRIARPLTEALQESMKRLSEQARAQTLAAGSIYRQTAAKAAFRALNELDATSIIGPRIAESMKTLDLPKALRAQIESLRVASAFSTAQLRPRLEEAMAEALVLAESSSDVGDVVVDSLDLTEPLSADDRDALLECGATAIGIFVIVAGMLLESKHSEVAGHTLVFVAVLMRMYFILARTDRHGRG